MTAVPGVALSSAAWIVLNGEPSDPLLLLLPLLETQMVRCGEMLENGVNLQVLSNYCDGWAAGMSAPFQPWFQSRPI
ncbi:hypothetical protein JL100_017215 [Skermanella mucosa]|uniref:hypothetical protein n=1 Tax=Skermanella mucosa TaxID=1789672 RepID=UPI001E390910|nr:hypothetical protein [Skermanella mucosa]UEM24174.1 hypothetical protein JL100_017215 [Skermanella mucosa]